MLRPAPLLEGEGEGEGSEVELGLMMTSAGRATLHRFAVVSVRASERACFPRPADPPSKLAVYPWLSYSAPQAGVNGESDRGANWKRSS